MQINSLQDLLVHELQDALSAEKQLLEALPEMAMVASNPQLKECFELHQQQTEIHVERLHNLASELGIQEGEMVCKAMQGILEEGKEILSMEGDREAIDAALIASAQKVEHYEIASYGSAIAHAQQLGMDEAVTTLEETLQEEKETDQKLTKFAVEKANVEATK